MNRAPMAVQDFMTPSVWTVGQQASLSQARELMCLRDVRHLPVLDGGALVGILSRRDIDLMEAVGAVCGRDVTVEDAMNRNILVASPDEPLTAVVRAMATYKRSAAVVVRDPLSIVGIFTTQDALAALQNALMTQPEKRPASSRKAPPAKKGHRRGASREQKPRTSATR